MCGDESSREFDDTARYGRRCRPLWVTALPATGNGGSLDVSGEAPDTAPGQYPDAPSGEAPDTAPLFRRTNGYIDVEKRDSKVRSAEDTW